MKLQACMNAEQLEETKVRMTVIDFNAYVDTWNVFTSDFLS